MVARRWLLAILVLATLAAGFPSVRAAELAAGDGWHEQLDHAPLPARWIQLPEGSLGAACGQVHRVEYRGNQRVKIDVYACAERSYFEGVCWVYAEFPREKMAGWQIEHEEEHCAGRDHVPR